MKKITIIANWKMSLSLHESIQLAEDVERGLPPLPASLRVFLCPSFTALPSVQPLLRQCLLGAQDVFWENRGAYTGEIAPSMLTDLGCHAVILGHSERRAYCGETSLMVHRKVQTALANNLTPIVCVGETAEERDRGQKEHVVIEQLTSALSGIDEKKEQDIFVVYEPVWAIGNGHVVAPEDAEQMHQLILHTLREMYSPAYLDAHVQVLYGGSVDRRSVGPLISMPHVGGCLVGTASWHAHNFLSIIDAALRI
ncbi:triose-phosphate isomerase [Candidatus Uhrbacteria bacterium]|nr:triose-phosphate isomerase [Candidatus Uhrbacteria bacterium]